MDASCFQTSERRKARIEIIPLIDVVFFLLATFVLFTMAMDRIRVLPLKMPEPVIGPAPIEDFTLYVEARQDGAYNVRLGKDTLPEILVPEMLRFRLQDYARSTPVPRVFILDDGKARFGAAIFALDQVRLAEIEHVSVDTRR